MINARLVELVKRHEGLRLEPYRDSLGILTIGYGHNLEAHEGPVPAAITVQEAEDLLEKDLADAIYKCQTFIRAYYPLDEVRRAVLTDMCFNMGIGSAETGKGLLSFRTTLARIAAGDYDLAADNMLISKWAEQVGGRAVEDAEMMRSGQWPAWLIALVPEQPGPTPAPIPERKTTWGDAVLAVIHWISGFFTPRA